MCRVKQSRARTPASSWGCGRAGWMQSLHLQELRGVIRAGGGQQLRSSASTNLPARSCSEAQPGFGSSRERLGMITQLLVPPAALPEPAQVPAACGSCRERQEQRALLLPCLNPILIHACRRISRKSCSEDLYSQSQGGLFSSEECLFPQWNTQDSHPGPREGRRH